VRIARLVALAIPLLLFRTAHAAPAAAPGFLILPFENTADDAPLAWLATGLALHTGEHLKTHGASVVDDEDRAVLLEGNGIPAGASITLASALELGRTMRARPAGVRPDRLLLGRFNVQEGQITLSARLIDLENEQARPWIERQGRLKDLLEVHASLVEALARDADLPGGRGRGKLTEPPLLAFETYCRGMAEADARRRLTLLRRALQEFPGYPTAAYQAAALLARAEKWDDAAETLRAATSDAAPYQSEYHLLDAAVALQRHDAAVAAEAAQKALDVADTARGHALLGRARVGLADRDAARGELDKAIAIDPSEPEIEELKKALAQGAPAAGRTP
jgi:tetratricopeptide (TPR) repeat protein